MAVHGAHVVISTQVLQEYFWVATRKLGVDSLNAKGVMQSAVATYETVTVSIDLIERAVDASILWQVSFWDALILTSAERAACATVYSEDLNDSQRYGEVAVVNPFRAPAADPSA
jgi:predicted nucleic acid-binding protein